MVNSPSSSSLRPLYLYLKRTWATYTRQELVILLVFKRDKQEAIKLKLQRGGNVSATTMCLKYKLSCVFVICMLSLMQVT